MKDYVRRKKREFSVLLDLPLEGEVDCIAHDHFLESCHTVLIEQRFAVRFFEFHRKNPAIGYNIFFSRMIASIFLSWEKSS